MAKLMQKFALIAGLFVFFVIFLAGALSRPGLDFSAILLVGVKAAIGGAIFWILGVVISDIAFKSILESVETGTEEKWEGGLMNRVIIEKEKSDPMAEVHASLSPSGKTAAPPNK